MTIATIASPLALERIAAPVEQQFDRIDRRHRKQIAHHAHSKRVRKARGKRGVL